ncbi:glycosyltransferase [Salinimicrobium xinjiangense]|uniref:glycosyltransferase n=1 Tax=Salinimicrobium xinjiangense TaxID=438596 RepID=UPI00041D1264|nr:glycosyltransferase [Salinimicrobium xinjiangense]
MATPFKNKFRRFLESALGKEPSDFKKIPIIINNYNRLTTLKQLISDLESRGYYNIHIIDNNSAYPPLLEFYETCEYKVHRLKKNIGFKALWKSGLWYKFIRGYYCYTDSDLSIVPECPDNFLEVFYKLLKKYPEVFKVGFSLKIDDLPDHYYRKQEVYDWESKFYLKEKEENVFIAPIDTTFALYRPFARRGKRDGSDEILRIGAPFECRHLPWYIDSNAPSEEELYYMNSVRKITHWTGKR